MSRESDHRPLILVVAASARAIVQALRRADCDSVAFDLFGDLDTRAAALITEVVVAEMANQGAPLALDPARVRAALKQTCERLSRSGRRIDAVICGSGIEAAPALLDDLAAVAPLAGNPRELIERVASPAQFFALLARLGLPYPSVCLSDLPPNYSVTSIDHSGYGDRDRSSNRDGSSNAANWLVKQAGGSGGVHIRAIGAHERLTLGQAAPGQYLQRALPAVAPHDGSFSVTFLALPNQIRLLGINRQWHGCVSNAYVYRGALSQVPLPVELEQQVIEQASALLGALAVRGLGSVDFVIHRGAVYWLEVNARPSASFELYEPSDSGQGSLIGDHLLATLALQTTTSSQSQTLPVRAHWQVYAECDCVISDTIAHAWRDQAAISDIPQPGSTVLAGMPICTVHAQAASHEAAVAKLRAAQQLVQRAISARDALL